MKRSRKDDDKEEELKWITKRCNRMKGRRKKRTEREDEAGNIIWYG